MLDYIPNINEIEKNGWTPIIVSCYYGNYEMVKRLIMKGANAMKTNYNGTNTLMYATNSFSQKKDYKVFELLLNEGVDVNHKDIYGKTVLDYITDISLKSFLSKF